MKEGDRGFCFVRTIENQQMVLDTYGKSTGFCIDPIEKKPLNHFYPGSSVLSFGTAGCNLGCQFCQNWDISKSREVAKLSANAEPETIATAAHDLDCRSVAFTYNDPVIWAEYAIDTAIACHDRGIKTVAVTAGYMMPEPRREFFQHIDAANVDLKAFSEQFYEKITYSRLQPVLETLQYLKHETEVWFEITNLIIPDANDSANELSRMCDWIVKHLGVDVPVHFSAFHPDFRMMDRPRTPHAKLLEAYSIAVQSGIRYPYVGNVNDSKHGSTYCYGCGELLIERDWYELGKYNLRGNLCGSCGAEQSGRFEERPGTWGRKRQPVNLSSFQTISRNSRNHRLSLPVLERQTNSETYESTRTQSNLSTEDAMTISTPVKLSMLKLSDLSEQQQSAIQRAARSVVIHSVIGRKLPSDWSSELGELGDQNVFGFFTTLKRKKQLRGCCGFLGKPTTLREAILSSAQRTAKDDNRMVAISPTELPYLSLGVSLLAAPIATTVPASERESAIQVGKHGLRITSGNQSGLLLPSVSLEQNWTPKQFLEGVCRKAGLPESAWTDPAIQLETFEGLTFDGAIDADALPVKMPTPHLPGSMQSLLNLKQVATSNIIAMTKGGTPSYVAMDAMDGTVNGIVLTVRNVKTEKPIANWIQTSLRPGAALQASLFDLCKAASETLSKTRFQEDVSIEIELTVLFDPIHHGSIGVDDWDGDEVRETMSQCDMSEVVPANRAVIALYGDRCAVAFDASKSVQQLVTEAALPLRTRRNPVAIFSMTCMSTINSLLASNAPQPFPESKDRLPAVADRFYPASGLARQALVNDFRIKTGDVEKVHAYAIMTPHAGLRFSGQVATDVWNRVQLPQTLLMIGPKHTANGCDWAVSPSSSWSIPEGGSWKANLDLAAEIAKGVEGMQLDSGAHATEHGIEVQLPILEGLTSIEDRPTVTAVVVRGATWEEIERASSQLAHVLQSQEKMPLLVISSDMNHYEAEAENRRRDELAIEAMLTGDPKHLAEVCQKNSISMCGLVPAAIVMQTLIFLGKKFRVERVSYDNSASRGGDKERVVGYAGMLIVPA
jgi:AmmeMemoRadiSam system radical SAM enzyme/AmmeMemoRadiSam system protein B/AmmeMemoRadiSam system protein A